MEVDQSNDDMNPMMDSLEHKDEEIENLEVASNTNKVSNACLPSSGKRTSTVWLHFRKGKTEKEKTMVICNYCGAKYTYSVDNGTSAMLKHLKKCNKYPRNIDKKQKIFTPRRTQGITMRHINTDGSATVLSAWEFDQNRCR